MPRGRPGRSRAAHPRESSGSADRQGTACLPTPTQNTLYNSPTYICKCYPTLNIVLLGVLTNRNVVHLKLVKAKLTHYFNPIGLRVETRVVFFKSKLQSSAPCIKLFLLNKIIQIWLLFASVSSYALDIGKMF